MLTLAWKNLLRRPLRTALTGVGLAVAVAVLGCLSAFGEGYQRGLHSELDRMGMQMMLVPLGCPYDAAARVLKGRTLENLLPADASRIAREDRAVAIAAPLLTVAVPRPREGRTDMWVGLDREALALKPWWKARAGAGWFSGPDSVILGSEAAATELREPGDRFYSPEAGKSLRVAGVLERSGTSDDSLFFVPLATAQSMFHQEGRITAVGIRLKDPALLPDASERLQGVRGAQVVTLTEMMGTFLNLVGAVRLLMLAIAVVAVCASALTVFNTQLGSVLERTAELSLLRAIGASRGHLFRLIALEATLLTLCGSVAGLALAAAIGKAFEGIVRRYVPLAPEHSILVFSTPILGECLLLGVGVGLVASLYPAWQASRMVPARAMRWES